jgi:hypothetical protein
MSGRQAVERPRMKLSAWSLLISDNVDARGRRCDDPVDGGYERRERKIKRKRGRG